MTRQELLQRARPLEKSEDVDAFIEEHPNSIIFKAGSCRRTDDALERLTTALEGRNDLPLGLIRVVEARAASQRVVEITGVRHESPQVIVMREKRAVFARDNWSATTEALRQGLESNFGPPDARRASNG
jgi:bacillithiol system protein YtxJ